MNQKTKILGFIMLAVTMIACNLSLNLSEPSPQATLALVQTETLVLPTPSATITVALAQQITVYFTDQNRFAVGTEPYEVAVTREVPAGVDPIRSVLDAFFSGPTPVETAQGLILVSSGFTGIHDFTIQNGIARIYLAGKCANNGAAYSVANLISRNLSQFSQITSIKIFDENNSNLDPDSNISSLPYCLEP